MCFDKMGYGSMRGCGGCQCSGNERHTEGGKNNGCVGTNSGPRRNRQMFQNTERMSFMAAGCTKLEWELWHKRHYHCAASPAARGAVRGRDDGKTQRVLRPIRRRHRGDQCECV